MVMKRAIEAHTMNMPLAWVCLDLKIMKTRSSISQSGMQMVGIIRERNETPEFESPRSGGIAPAPRLEVWTSPVGNSASAGITDIFELTKPLEKHGFG